MLAGRREKSWERFEASPDGQYLAFLGNDGYTVLVSAKTKQWVANLKMNGSVRAIAFNKANSNELFTTGGVYSTSSSYPAPACLLLTPPHLSCVQVMARCIAGTCA